MTKYVLDASAILAYYLPDEKLTPEMEGILTENKPQQLIAPRLLKIEFANALKKVWLMKRIERHKIFVIFDNFLSSNVEYKEVDYTKSISISLEYNLNVYDSVYIALASKERAQLLTLDRRLQTIQEKLHLKG